MRWALLPIPFLAAACSASTSDAGHDQDGSMTADAPAMTADAHATTDATLPGPADAGLDATSPSGDADAGPACVPNDGTYTCLGGSWPACPSTTEPSAACDADAQACMGCSEGAGFTCECSDAGGPQYDGGPVPYWSCVGTEYTCQ